MKHFMKNAEAFDQVLGHCTTKGDSYNPTDAAMKCTALQALLEETQKSIQAVHNAQSDLADAINHRHRAFDPLPDMGRRILGALKACQAPPDMIADVDRIRKRFSYQRPKRTAAEIGSEQPGQSGTDGEGSSTQKTRGRVSYLDFKSKITTLLQIIRLLKKEPKYVPIEELSIESLKGLLGELISSNRKVKYTELDFYNARQACEQNMFGENGIVTMGYRIKNHFGSKFGFSSEAYNAISKIKFVKQ
jgi:hypothetical protein